MKSLADMHMHTIMSGHAYGTIWVHEKNLKMIGITEHDPGAVGELSLAEGLIEEYNFPKFLV